LRSSYPRLRTEKKFLDTGGTHYFDQESLKRAFHWRGGRRRELRKVARPERGTGNTGREGGIPMRIKGDQHAHLSKGINSGAEKNCRDGKKCEATARGFCGKRCCSKSGLRISIGKDIAEKKIYVANKLRRNRQRRQDDARPSNPFLMKPQKSGLRRADLTKKKGRKILLGTVQLIGEYWTGLGGPAKNSWTARDAD